MRKLLSAVIAAIFVPLLGGQQTVEQQVLAELLSWREAPLYYKAPIDSSLPPFDLRLSDLPLSLHTVDADAGWITPANEEPQGTLIGDLGDARVAGAIYAQTEYANGQQTNVYTSPAIQGRLVQFTTPILPCPTGVCVSFGSQGAAALQAVTGKRIKGFQMVEAIVYANHDANVSIGLILMIARQMGIQTIDNQSGIAIVNKTVSMDWRTIGKVVIVGGLAVGTALTVGGLLPASVALTQGFTFGHLFVDQILPPLFAIGAPKPDPYLNAAMDPDKTVKLAAGQSMHLMVGAIYSGAKSSISTGPILLMP